jgi:tetratricopeptide (TPR) repeat protein
MYQRFCGFILVAMGLAALPLGAQQPCPSFTVAVNTDEDQLMLAVNGANGPQDQLTALDKFAQEHADSKFMPCVNEYYATANFKLNNFDKAIEYAEKDLAVNYQDLNLFLTLMRAYASSTKVSDTVFEVINKVPDQAKAETGTPARPPKATEEEWAKIQKDSQELAKDSHDYAVWAFFQILPRVTDPAKRIQVLDTFLKVYPEQEKENAAQINRGYFEAYRLQNNLDKTVEYGEKAIAADPNDLAVINLLGFIYGVVNRTNLDRALDYAKKSVTLAQNVKKPEGVSDEAFKQEQNNQLAMAHLTIGFVDFQQAGKTRKVAPAIEELKTASELASANPQLQGQALFYLANAYEYQFPANHRAAMDALNKAVTLPGPFQSQAQALLAKVKAAVNK